MYKHRNFGVPNLLLRYGKMIKSQLRPNKDPTSPFKCQLKNNKNNKKIKKKRAVSGGERESLN
jgi:hypothetical protein